MKERIDNKIIDNVLVALTHLRIELEQKDLDIDLQNTCIRLINYLGHKREDGWGYED